MQNSQDIQWKRLAAEGVAIVVGILLAFWIDAWWEARQDDSHERVVLEILLLEFQEIKENIDDVQDYQVAILESVYRLAELSEYPDPEVSEEEINRLLGDLTWYSSPDNFSAPKLNSIIERGDISTISDRSLRMQLLSLPDNLRWIETTLRTDEVYMETHIDPFLNRNASFLLIQHAGQKRPGNSGITFPAPPFEPATAFSHRNLLESREFQNMLIQRAALLIDIISLSRTPDLPEQIDETIKMIEQELN